MSVGKQTDQSRTMPLSSRAAAGRVDYFSDADRRTQHDEDASAWLTVTLELIGVVGLGVAGMAITVAWIVLSQ